MKAKVDRENLAIVRQCFANTVLSHKTHEMAVERKSRRITIFKILNIVVIALVLTIFVVQAMWVNNPILGYIGAGLTAAEIVLLISHLTFGTESDTTAHKNSALKYMSLRDRYKPLVADLMKGTISKDEIEHKRDELLREYQMIADLSLQTSIKDYQKAMKSLKLTEDDENVWSDKQVDSLLPKELRLTK